MILTFTVYKKFPCNIIEMTLRRFNQKKFSKSLNIEFSYPYRLYMTKEGNFVITNIKLENNQKYGFYGVKENCYLKSFGYERTSHDYYKELFKHNFNGSEKLYTCNFDGYIVYYIVGTKKHLWEKRPSNK